MQNMDNSVDNSSEKNNCMTCSSLSSSLKNELFFIGKALLTPKMISIPLLGLKKTAPLSDSSGKTNDSCKLPMLPSSSSMHLNVASSSLGLLLI
jgi:hypothetical protein